MKHFDAKEVKQAASGQWIESIYKAASIDVVPNKHQPCPACGGTDRFRCDDRHGNGDYYCNQCGAGDGFNLLMKIHGCSFDSALSFVASVIGLSLDGKPSILPTRVKHRPPQPIYTPDNPNPAAVKQGEHIRNSASADDGTINRYLVSRGITTGASSPAFIRLMQAYEPASKTTLPCMVCPIRTADGYVTGYHKTYLDPNTGDKAQIENPKRFTPALYDGAYKGCSVWLGRPDGRLIVCEGIETGLAVQQMMNGRAVWCSLSASMMKNITLPSHVRVVEIWCDNDTNQTGQQAAQILHDRLRADSILVKIVTPPDPDTDWLDVLNQRKAVIDATA